MTVNPPDRRTLLFCPENLSAREGGLARELAGAGPLQIVVPSAGPLGVEPPPGTRVVSWRTLGRPREAARPDFVVYASPPSAAWHWKVWWWKRRHAPGALLGGSWDAAPTGRRNRQQRLAGRALDSLDFWLAADQAAGEALAAVGVPRGRTLLTQEPAENRENLPAFLERRWQAEARSVLWVDDDLSLSSPSTKHLVTSLPRLQAEGWEVRGWCLSADATARAGMEVRQFSAPPARLRWFTPYWFFGAVNLHGLGQTILKGRPPARIVHSVGSAFLGADLSAIHFVHHLWLRRQIALRPRSRKAVLELLWTALALGRDQLQYRNPRCGMFLPVSDSIAAAVRRSCLPGAEVRTLPNSYDESRFHPTMRQQWRRPMRRDLGLTEDQPVFCFASQGHYKRKGFWRAAEALARLRRQTDLPQARDLRFLVIGGQPGTLARLQADLSAPYPDWREWMIFVGTQPAVERYFAAADAFLFPSYFEAFCLAEIEAGAMGLPLLLTAHPGTEMILQDGVNGVRLSEDQAKLTEQVGEFLRRGLPPFPASAGRALDRSAYAKALAGIYAEFLERTT